MVPAQRSEAALAQRRPAATCHQRSYGIEGNTAPRCTDPHDLGHMLNGDFADGTTGWAIEPAEEGSVRLAKQEGLGWLQGRYPRTSEGDTGLLMIRSDKGPNVFRQPINGLEPGRLYSFRMFCSDYDDMSQEELHAVTVTLEGAELIEDKCFNHVGHNCYSHAHGPGHRHGLEEPFRAGREKRPEADLQLRPRAALLPRGPPSTVRGRHGPTRFRRQQLRGP